MAKLRKGESISRTSNGILVGKWKDKRDVVYITSEFTNEMDVHTTRRGEEKEKPIPILEYNKYMGGIDRQDQMNAYYPCERKTLRWYKKLGIHIIHLLFINAHFLYRKFGTNRKMPFYDFRIAVLEELLQTTQEPTVRVGAEQHVLEKTPKNGKWKRVYRKCVRCTKRGGRFETRYYCRLCPRQPALCIECFPLFHRNE